MISFSPKIEIINHFDSLINRLDIEIEEGLEKYKEDQVLGNLHRSRKTRELDKQRCIFNYCNLYESFESNKYNRDENWSASTKVIDYLNQVRMRTIEELRNGQDECMEYLKSNSSYQLSTQNNHISNTKEDIDELKSRLFGKKFYFQVLLKPSKENKWILNLYTFVADFYISPFDIEFLETLINPDDDVNFINNRLFSDSIFDEKLILLCAISKYFREIIKREEITYQIINVCKQDLLNLKGIRFNYDILGVNLTACSTVFPKLERLKLFGSLDLKKINIESSCSLDYLSLSVRSVERCSIGNFYALRHLSVHANDKTNKDILTKLFEQCPNIEKLSLHITAHCSCHLNLARFAHLKELTFEFFLIIGFNFDSLKSLCNQLEKLEILCRDVDDKVITKLLCTHEFTNLLSLDIFGSRITMLEKKLFSGFPKLESLRFSNGYLVRKMDNDTFSNLKNLKCLHLCNIRMTKIVSDVFVDLNNLEELNLSRNLLTHFDIRILDYIDKIKKIDLSGNSILNKEEILNYFKDYKVIITL